MDCLECAGLIPLPTDPLVGEVVVCPDCGASFELVANGNSGMELRAAAVEAEDWGE